MMFKYMITKLNTDRSTSFTASTDHVLEQRNYRGSCVRDPMFRAARHILVSLNGWICHVVAQIKRKGTFITATNYMVLPTLLIAWPNEMSTLSPENLLFAYVKT